MPALNFKMIMAERVACGSKRQTIRAYRRGGRDPKVGDTLFAYVGMRTAYCKKLGEFIAGSVEPISIERNGICGIVRVNGERLSESEIFELSRDDGFSDDERFFDFFENIHGLPFQGLLIKW